MLAVNSYGQLPATAVRNMPPDSLKDTHRRQTVWTDQERSCTTQKLQHFCLFETNWNPIFICKAAPVKDHGWLARANFGSPAAAAPQAQNQLAEGSLAGLVPSSLGNSPLGPLLWGPLLCLTSCTRKCNSMLDITQAARDWPDVREAP